MRRLLLLTAAAATASATVLFAPGASAGKLTATIQATSDWGATMGTASNESGVPVASSTSLNGFIAACQAEANGAAGALDAFFASPLQGFDGVVFDLGEIKDSGGKFEVKGPGSKVIVSEPSTVGDVPEYDLDLYFYGDVAESEGGLHCPDRNNVTSDHKCYSTTADADEKATCTLGKTFRYVAVAASLNLTGGPIDIELTTPF